MLAENHVMPKKSYAMENHGITTLFGPFLTHYVQLSS